MARSLTVISLLLHSTTHCRYRVYTKFLLTCTAIYRGNRKVLPLGITALQPQSHFHLGTPYIKYPLFLSDLNETWIFSTVSSKNIHISNFRYIRLVGAEFLPAGRRAERQTKIIVAFRNFTNAPKKSYVQSFGTANSVKSIHVSFSYTFREWQTCRPGQ